MGADELTRGSNLLCQIGFGCRQEPDALRVGPFMPNDKITKGDVAIMDQYMLRTWVELSIALAQFQQRSGMSVSPAGSTSLISRSDPDTRPVRDDADTA